MIAFFSDTRGGDRLWLIDPPHCLISTRRWNSAHQGKQIGRGDERDSSDSETEDEGPNLTAQLHDLG